MVLDGVNVGLRLVEIRRNGGDELGASSLEELLEDGEGLGTSTLKLEKLITVLLAESGVDGVVETSGVEGDADGDESVHLLVLLGDAIILSILVEVLRPRHIDENVAEHADGIGIATHHHVRETNVVVRCEVSGHDPGEHGLLVELDIVQGLEGKTEISEQTVDSEKADNGEITQHLIHVLGAILSSELGGVLVSLHRRELLGDLGSLDEGVEDVEDAVAAPSVGVVAEELDFLFVRRRGRGLPSDSHTIGGEGVELVDELVDDVPRPVILCPLKC